MEFHLEGLVFLSHEGKTILSLKVLKLEIPEQQIVAFFEKFEFIKTDKKFLVILIEMVGI
jgi:hypothetical protein